MFKNPRLTLLIVMALLAGAVATLVNKPPHLGLDLKGGTRLTLQAEATEAVPVLDEPVLDSLQYIIEQRVNKFGISEALVQRQDGARLLVEIPGIKNPEEARKQLGKVGNLEFKAQDAEGNWIPSGVGGQDLQSARLDTKQNGEWIVSFMLNGPGTQRFGELTQKLAKTHERLGIFFDGELVSAPSVNTPIMEGSGYIEGNFERSEAKSMVDLLNAGALPVDVNVIEESTVGPLLGAASIQKSLMAGLMGLALVLVFMVGFYRARGFVANIALVAYSVLTLALYLLVDVTFTLAGIAGFILSIGMAVDANILIFERMKEELTSGRSMKKAVQVGFDRAFPSIFDSNMTTVITCALLWWLGTGSVKGFALTLAIGVAVSMFTAITVSRTVLELMLGGSSTQRQLTYSRG
jgi:preprotein translocase subunit SecD